MKNTISLSKFSEKCIDEFTFELCQKQGWFEVKSLSDITETDRKEVYWQNNYDFAVASYVFWRDAFNC